MSPLPYTVVLCQLRLMYHFTYMVVCLPLHMGETNRSPGGRRDYLDYLKYH